MVLVFVAGGSPQQLLRFCSFGCELVPAGSGEQSLVILIGHLRVRDCDLALQRTQPFLLAGVVGLGDLFVELLVDGRVDAADEERGDAGDMRGIADLDDVVL